MAEKPLEDFSSKSNSPLKIALGLILVIIIASFLLRWLLALIVPILLIANRDLVFKIGGKILEFYKQDTLKGIGATVLAFVLFTPFTVFLFFRTIVFLVTGSNLVSTDDKGEKTTIDITTKKKEKRKDGLMSLDEIRRKLDEDDF